MKRTLTATILLATASAFALAQPPRTAQRPSTSNSAPKPTGPKLQAVAETKLLMEGMLHANFLGLEKILREKNIQDESWTYARGQALLIAESGNLLMLRPPKNNGEEAWMRRAGNLREGAAQLAKIVEVRDPERSRVALTQLAKSCNACHQTFQVATKITAFEPEKP